MPCSAGMVGSSDNACMPCQSKSVWSLVRRAVPQARCVAANAHSPSMSFHRSRILAALIHVSLFFFSLPFVASVSSELRKSLVSSSHFCLGLPTDLHVVCLMLWPGFHSAAFFAHRSSSSDAGLIAYVFGIGSAGWPDGPRQSRVAQGFLSDSSHRRKRGRRNIQQRHDQQ